MLLPESPRGAEVMSMVAADRVLEGPVNPSPGELALAHIS
jgi:hypothetical protein